MLESLDIDRIEPYDGWTYEWVAATGRFAVDPLAAGNACIADLDLALRDTDGRVRFDADVRLLRPTASGNGRTLIVIPNRGMTGGVPFSLDAPLAWGPDSREPGDGFLLADGWTIAWCGWQWDVLRRGHRPTGPGCGGRAGLDPRRVPPRRPAGGAPPQ